MQSEIRHIVLVAAFVELFDFPHNHHPRHRHVYMSTNYMMSSECETNLGRKELKIKVLKLIL